MVKLCTKCGEAKPLTEYHRNRAAPDGKRSECKSCACSRSQHYYAVHVRPKFSAGPASAVCGYCGEPFEYVKATGPRRIYCSDRCRYEGGERARAPEYTRRCDCGSADVNKVGKPVCPECKVDKRDPGVARAKQRRRTLRQYGLSEADWGRLIERQGDRCAICRTDTPGGKGETWHIDHDHDCCPRVGSCGQCVRGLLCGRCNMMLGSAGDMPERLRAGATYLEAARQPPLFAAA